MLFSPGKMLLIPGLLTLALAGTAFEEGAEPIRTLPLSTSTHTSTSRAPRPTSDVKQCLDLLSHTDKPTLEIMNGTCVAARVNKEKWPEDNWPRIPQFILEACCKDTDGLWTEPSKIRLSECISYDQSLGQFAWASPGSTHGHKAILNSCDECDLVAELSNNATEPHLRCTCKPPGSREPQSLSIAMVPATPDLKSPYEKGAVVDLREANRLRVLAWGFFSCTWVKCGNHIYPPWQKPSYMNEKRPGRMATLFA